MHPDLSPIYYLSNFQHVLADIAARYDDLLAHDEMAFLSTFAALSTPAQALLVRLIMRTRDVFDRDAISYEEIADIPAALAELEAVGCVNSDAALSLDELFALTTKADLLAGLGGEGLTARQRKDEMRAALEHLGDRRRRLGEWLQDSARCAVRLNIRSIAETLRLLFFGNLYQTWSEFVVADLGHLRYESVPLLKNARGFSSRDDLMVSRTLHELRARLDAGESVADLLNELPTISESCAPTSQARLNKFQFELGQVAERSKDWSLAQTLYSNCDYKGSRHRLVRVYEQQQQWQAAYDTACEVLDAPASEEELQATWRALPRLTKKLGLAARAPAHLQAAPTRTITLATAPEVCVEVSVAQHLTSPSHQVRYVENTLFSSLFGLLFWEAIFAPVPGAFFNAYQSGPADLFHPTFAAVRETLIAQCFERLEQPSLRDRLLSCWKEKQGIQNPFVFWGHLDETLIDQAIAHIPTSHWRSVFSRMLADLKTNRSGFPDLIAFDQQQGSYTLLEVKAPGDRVQDNQARWMDHFLRHGIPCEVIHVSWPT